MFTVRRHLRRFAALAWLAMFALALVPTVSRALSVAQPGQPWAALCSAVDAPGSRQPGAATHTDHCALCVVAAAANLPPAEATPWAACAAAGFAAIGAAPATLARAPWAHAQPRGPPATFC